MIVVLAGLAHSAQLAAALNAGRLEPQGRLQAGRWSSAGAPQRQSGR